MGLIYNSLRESYRFRCDSNISEDCTNFMKNISKLELKLNSSNKEVNTFIKNIINEGWVINSVTAGYCPDCVKQLNFDREEKALFERFEEELHS